MEISIQCLYCYESFTVPVHHEDGDEQFFVYDCEICCHPLNIKLIWNESEETFSQNISKTND